MMIYLNIKYKYETTNIILYIRFSHAYCTRKAKEKSKTKSDVVMKDLNTCHAEAIWGV